MYEYNGQLGKNWWSGVPPWKPPCKTGWSWFYDFSLFHSLGAYFAIQRMAIFDYWRFLDYPRLYAGLRMLLRFIFIFPLTTVRCIFGSFRKVSGTVTTGDNNFGITSIWLVIEAWSILETTFLPDYFKTALSTAIILRLRNMETNLLFQNLS